MFTANEENSNRLKPYLSPLGAWALSFGCAVGWGAFMMPGNTFLPIGGPIGVILGMTLGGGIMLLIGINYAYMINHYPDAGGTYTFLKKELGYDHGFLGAWFLLLVYMAIIWANATAIPLACKNLFQGALEVGPHYNVAGFEVYVNEALIAVIALIVAGAVVLHGGKTTQRVQSVFAILLIGGIVLSAIIVFISASHDGGVDLKPAFSKTGNPAVSVFRIIALAPWAYAGFESISQSTEEFKFSPKKSLPIMIFSLIAGILSYSLLSVIAISLLPERYNDWEAYIYNLGSIEGIEGLPTFYAMYTALPKYGLIILGITLLSGIMTGLIGNMVAASRLLYSLSRDDLLPKRLSAVNKHGVPTKLIIIITAISLVIPFFGRTAISWIVDVNTIGATIAYLLTSFVAFKTAKEAENKGVMITGILGIIISFVFTMYFLVPNFWSASIMSEQSYLIFILWGILGFVFFYYVFKRDTKNRFGKNTVVWLVLLFLVLFVTLLWFRESSKTKTEEVLINLNEYNEKELAEHGVTLDKWEMNDSEDNLRYQLNEFDAVLIRNSILQMAVVIFLLFILFRLFSLLHERERKTEREKIKATESSKAKTMFLSNMSHDIRTPMNAIVGYTELAKELPETPENVKEYLNKIDNSGKHLLNLINDILDMSRIESGKMEIYPENMNLLEEISGIKDTFDGQMKEKNLVFKVDMDAVKDSHILADANAINRILNNMISNAYKFTPEGGEISLTVKETGKDKDIGHYEIHVKDTGIGMTPEFADRVFDAYERDRRVTKIQGTGLGTAITKSLVTLMGGTIEVVSEVNKGTEFIIKTDFKIASAPVNEENVDSTNSERLKGLKVLLVEDMAINREIAKMMLEGAGLIVDCAENGKEALNMISISDPGEYTAVIMDVNMPVMNGYEAARSIRNLPNKDLNSIPIIAMTANAFAEDVREAYDAGMNAHIAKPIDKHLLYTTLSEVISLR